MSDKTNLITHYSAVVVGAVSGLSFNQWVSLVMALIAIATFLVNWDYKRKYLDIMRQKNAALTTDKKGSNHGSESE